jgi:hypothetical protein
MFFIARFVFRQSALIIGLPSCDQVMADAGKLVRSRRYSLREPSLARIWR